nr:MAG TPA: PROTEIN/RNA Complex ribosomal subunit, ribonucleoprotein, ribosomal [Caudoviricetes sp.]
MKEFKIRYEWNGKVFAEPVIGKNLIDATATFVEQLYSDTNSWERCKSGFKLCM